MTVEYLLKRKKTKLDYNSAKDCLMAGNIKFCEKFFLINNYYLEFGYCKLLSGDISVAKKTFAKISNNNIRAHWALRLIQFIEGFVTYLPSYFEIRNFLEIDITLLLNVGKADYVENIINGADLFYQVNQETYKFLARVMMNEGFPKAAKIFIDRGKDKCYNDPELHYINAIYHINQKDKVSAKIALENCLKLFPHYFPAKNLLKIVSDKNYKLN